MARELTRAEIRWLERKERDEAIQRLRDDGYTIREIAAETGVSVGTVHNGLRRSREDLEAWRKATAEEMNWEYTPSPRPTVKEIIDMLIRVILQPVEVRGRATPVIERIKIEWK